MGSYNKKQGVPSTSTSYMSKIISESLQYITTSETTISPKSPKRGGVSMTFAEKTKNTLWKPSNMRATHKGIERQL